jgi:hypothetical protein
MRDFIYQNRLFIAIFILVIVSNIVILYGVFSNRVGDSTSEVSLSKKEFIIPYQNRYENSIVSLQLNYRTPNSSFYSVQDPHWLTVQKLKQLGFYIETEQKGENFRYPKNSEKELFIVLEYSGKAYQNSLEFAKKRVQKLQKISPKDEKTKRELKYAIKKLDDERYRNSRLFVIDAGVNPNKLISKYQDKSKYIITKAVIKVRYTSKGVKGYISSLVNKKIYVPLEYRKSLQQMQNIEDTKYNYRVVLKYGTKFEPYISDIKQYKIEDKK